MSSDRHALVGAVALLAVLPRAGASAAAMGAVSRRYSGRLVTRAAPSSSKSTKTSFGEQQTGQSST